jgi:hypothetical protein
LQPDAEQPVDDGLDDRDWLWVSDDDQMQSHRLLTEAEINEAVQEFERNIAALVAEIDADTSLD